MAAYVSSLSHRQISAILVLSSLGLLHSCITPDKEKEEHVPAPQYSNTDTLDLTGYVDAGDGTRLFYRRWLPQEVEKSRVIAIVFHGIGYHSAPYAVIGDYLSTRGVIVYAFDARGHGHSGRVRGNMESAGKIKEDVGRIVTFVRQTNPQRKLFLIGESMGSAFVSSYVVDRQSGIAGIILIAPPFKVHCRQSLNLRTILLLPILVLFRDRPVLSLVDKKADESTRDQGWLAARKADMLALSQVSGNYLFIIHQLTSGWKLNIPSRVNVPTLILHGEHDRIIDASGSILFFRALAAEDKEVVIVPHAPHTLLWDETTPMVLDKIYKWLSFRAAP